MWCFRPALAFRSPCAARRHGFDITRLQRMLGHLNLNTTAVYLQSHMRDLQEAFANVPF